jgi:hypothetical protein
MSEIQIKARENNFYGLKADRNGEFVFELLASNDCEGDLEDAIYSLTQTWNLDVRVTLSVSMRVRDILKNLTEDYLYGDGRIGEQELPMFDALRNDCQYIVEQIDALKKKSA